MPVYKQTVTGRILMTDMATIIANTEFNPHYRLLLPRRTRHEIFDGESFAVPAPEPEHQSITLRIAAGLLHHIEDRKLGWVFQAPCNLVLSERIVLQPDVLFVGWKRRNIIRKMNLRGAPDLVIEVLSRASRDRDLAIKRKLYARYDVPECWIVDPAGASIEPLIWSELGYVSVGKFRKSDRLCTPLLPSLNLRPSSIFRD
jgi:Uma2 family endonuclease